MNRIFINDFSKDSNWHTYGIESFKSYIHYTSICNGGRAFRVQIDYAYLLIHPRTRGIFRSTQEKVNNKLSASYQEFERNLKTINGIVYTISKEQKMQDYKVDHLKRKVVTYGKTIMVDVPESIASLEYEKTMIFKNRLLEKHGPFIKELADFVLTDNKYNWFDVGDYGVSKYMRNYSFSEQGMSNLQGAYQISGMAFAILETIGVKEYEIGFNMEFFNDGMLESVFVKMQTDKPIGLKEW